MMVRKPIQLSEASFIGKVSSEAIFGWINKQNQARGCHSVANFILWHLLGYCIPFAVPVYSCKRKIIKPQSFGNIINLIFNYVINQFSHRIC